MKSKVYKSNFLKAITVIILVHLITLFTGIFHLPLGNLFIIDGFLFSLFVASTFIISPGLDKEADNFVNRFLLLTTLQLLTMMVSVLLLSTLKIEHFKAIGYHLLIVFICLLAVQAFMLVRLIKNN